MKVALKQLRDTLAWLQIVERGALFAPLDRYKTLIDENNERISIFVTSVATAQRNLDKQ